MARTGIITATASTTIIMEMGGVIIVMMKTITRRLGRQRLINRGRPLLRAVPRTRK